MYCNGSLTPNNISLRRLQREVERSIVLLELWVAICGDGIIKHTWIRGKFSHGLIKAQKSGPMTLISVSRPKTYFPFPLRAAAFRDHILLMMYNLSTINIGLMFILIDNSFIISLAL